MQVCLLMIFPVDLGELSVLLALTAIIVLITSELISPYNRRFSILLNRKRLRIVGMVFSVLFLVTVAVKAYEIILAAS
jgi:hypothetical protein